MSEWDGPATRYEITVAGDDDVLEEIAVALRAWANPRGRRFFMWRAMPKEAPAAPAAPAIDVERLAEVIHELSNREAVGVVVEPTGGTTDTGGWASSNVRECIPADHLPYATVLATAYNERLARLANPEKP